MLPASQGMWLAEHCLAHLETLPLSPEIMALPKAERVLCMQALLRDITGEEPEMEHTFDERGEKWTLTIKQP
jgi:hypothetical protein